MSDLPDPTDPTIDASAATGIAGPGGDLRGTTVRSVGWTTAAQSATQAIQLIASLVITRLLVPSDFGLSGMVLVFFGLATLLSDFGLHQALVQRPALRPAHLVSAFWAQVALGTAASALGAASAPLVARFYGEPRLLLIAAAMAPGFLLSAVGTVPQAILVREFKFKALAASRIFTAVLASGSAVVVAALGGGVWSFVVLSLVTAGASSASAWVFSRWRPHGGFDRVAFRELTGYGSRIFGFSIMSYGTQNLDNLLIGRFLGAGPLGLYVRAFTLVVAPTRQVSATLGQVMFSALSRLGEQKERTKRIYLRTVAAIAVVSFPVMIGLAVTCDEFVRTAFGPQWVGAITVMRVFCLMGAIAPLAATTGWVYQSQGRADLLLRWGIGAGSVYMASIVIGIALGSMETVAVAIAVNYVVLLYPGFAIPGKLIGMTFGDVCRAVAGPTVATAVMAVVVIGVDRALDPSWSSPVRLVIEAAVGALVYAAAVHFGRVAAYRDLREVGAEQVGRLRRRVR